MMQKLKFLALNSGKVFKTITTPNIPLENKRLTLSALFLWEAGEYVIANIINKLHIPMSFLNILQE